MTLTRCRYKIGLYSGGFADTAFTHAALQPLVQKGYEITDLTTDDILKNNALNPNTTEYAAFFLCGNREGQRYRDELGKAGNEAIRLYTLRGGITIGICAGSYLLMDHVDYKSPNKINSTYDNIGLIKGTAHGQLPLLLPDVYHLDGWFRANTTNLHLLHQGKDAELLYWGGARFSPAPDQHISTFAVYNHPEFPNAPAVIGRRYGSGYVAALGIHPEISAAALANLSYAHRFDTDDGTHRLNLIKTLEKNETARAALWDEAVVRPILSQPNRLGERKPRPCFT